MSAEKYLLREVKLEDPFSDLPRLNQIVRKVRATPAKKKSKKTMVKVEELVTVKQEPKRNLNFVAFQNKKFEENLTYLETLSLGTDELIAMLESEVEVQTSLYENI